MNIKFEKLILNNFFSFEHEEIPLDNEGYILVQGTNYNEEDNASSNGSGKSTIWEGISWCLTGETIRGTKDVKRIGSTSKCYVTLYFSIDSHKYQVTRTKNNDTTSLKLFVDGCDKSGKGVRDTEKILHEYIPELSPQLIGSVIILGQGLPMRFTNNSPSGRKDVLEKLSKSDFMITDIKERIAKRILDVESKLSEVNNEMIAITTKIPMLDREIDSNMQTLNSLEDVTFLEKQLSTLNKDIVTCESSLKTDKALYDSLTTAGILLSKDLQMSSDILEQTLQFKSEEFEDRINDLQDKIINLTSTLNTKTSEINRLDSVTDICPTCGQKIEGVVKIDTSELKSEAEKIRSDLDSVQSQLKRVKDEKAAALQDVRDDHNSMYSAYTKKLWDNRAAQSAANDKVQEDQKTVQEIKNKQQLITYKINTLSSTKLSCEQKIKEAQENKEELDKSLLYNNNELENYSKRLEVLKKMNTLIARDFRGYLLQDIITFIDTKAKDYCKEVFDTDKLSFELDGNNISIKYCGKEYENLSGGERCKCDIILQLALRNMLCRYLDFSSNIFVLDEGLDYLDPVGCEKILQLIYSKLKDVEGVYVITHHQDLPITFDYEMNVVKGKDGISKVS